MTKFERDRAIQCAKFCQDIYQDLAFPFRFRGYPDEQPIVIDQPYTDTQCAILHLPSVDMAVIVFRGSQSELDWRHNIEFTQTKFDFDQEIIQGQIVSPHERQQLYPYKNGSHSGAKMHRGFVKAYLSVRDRIHAYLNQVSLSQVLVTGHSLGGAIATLCAVDVQYNFGYRTSVEVYTYGAPRVGNAGFRDSYNRRLPRSYRFVNGMDIVPALPRYWQNYRHVDSEIRLGKRFSFRFISQRFRDHAIANYLAALNDLDPND